MKKIIIETEPNILKNVSAEGYYLFATEGDGTVLEMANTSYIMPFDVSKLISIICVMENRLEMLKETLFGEFSEAERESIENVILACRTMKKIEDDMTQKTTSLNGILKEDRDHAKFY